MASKKTAKEAFQELETKQLQEKLNQRRQEEAKQCVQEVNEIMKKHNCAFAVTLNGAIVNIGINGSPLVVMITPN